MYLKQLLGGLMKISAKGRYALRLMLDLALHNTGGWVTLKEASERQGISIKYLEQVVALLTRANLLKSSRGSQGGYMLVKHPSEYSVGEVLRVTEGEIAPSACLEDTLKHSHRKGFCPTLPFWRGLYEVINAYLNSKSLQDLLDEQQHFESLTYSI